MISLDCQDFSHVFDRYQKKSKGSEINISEPKTGIKGLSLLIYKKVKIRQKCI